MTVALILQSAPPIDATSAVSIGVLVIVLGAAVRMTSALTRIDAKLQTAIDQIKVLAPLPSQVALLEQRMVRAEADINELWGLQRADAGRRPVA